MRLFTLFFLSLTLLLLQACSAQQKGEQPQTNALINESSPYLLQHAHNPVDWMPWNDKALEKAQKEDKLLIISVGYAACHWCHVMEHESFEDSTVAALMNESFVSINVDREERPDVDDIYMSACQLMSRRGCGWPLNVLALPDGRPLFAGTYYPKDQWLNILGQVRDFYASKPEEARKVAEQVTQGIQGYEGIVMDTTAQAYTEADQQQMFANFVQGMDFEWGGRKGAPKFPMPANLRYALTHHAQSGDVQARSFALLSLDKMAAGGIYDHLGGGFARYSTDGNWKVPHFEKMLYDNAQLISLYVDAWRLTGKARYKQVVYESLGFVERALTSPEGGFYSSLDADSEGEEGKFYVWQAADIDSLLGEGAALFKAAYEVSEKGNWEGKNVLHRRQTEEELGKSFGLSVERLNEQLEASRKLLLAKRAERERPGLDDKVITAWNALMLHAYVDAYRAFGEERFLETALRSANFLRSHCITSEGRMSRIYKAGKSSINAFLDDYALTAVAFVNLYQATFDPAWLDQADQLTDYALDHFFDPGTGMFFYTSDLDDPLITRKMETTDNVIPGSNSVMATALFQLGTLLYQDEYLQKAAQMLANVKEGVVKNPDFYANWARLMLWQVKPVYEVAIVGKEWSEKRKELDKSFLPNVLLLGGEKEGTLQLLKNKRGPGQTTIYVCQNKLCKLPVTEVTQALNLIKNFN
jgi:uncharacterized protein YyaL (SSP411 family)